MRKFPSRILLVHFGVSFGASALLWYLSSFSFFWCFLIVEAALLLNGFIAGAGGSSKS